MIDTHIHVVPPGLPGVGSLAPLLDGPAEQLVATLRAEMQMTGATHALAMGRWGTPEDDPLGVTDTLRLAQAVPGLHAIGVADPTCTEPEHLRRAEAVVAT